MDHQLRRNFHHYKTVQNYRCYGKGKEKFLSPYRLKEKLKVKNPNLIFHHPMARNRSNLLYADIVISGDVVETIPDDPRNVAQRQR